MKKAILCILLVIVTIRVFCNIVGTSTGIDSTRFLIDDRIRNNFSQSTDGMFYVSTFGLENFVPGDEVEMPTAKPGRLIKFGVQNSDWGWNFTNLQIVRMDSCLYDVHMNTFNANAYEPKDIDEIERIYGSTYMYRYYGGTGCWASPIIIKDGFYLGNLLILNKSGMLMCIDPQFITTSGINAQANVLWSINLRNEERQSVNDCCKYEYMATPTIKGDYVYIAGIRNLFKINISGIGTPSVVNNLSITLNDSDYLLHPIIFDTSIVAKLYTTSFEGKIIECDESFTNLSTTDISNHVFTPMLVDADGYIYFAGADNVDFNQMSGTSKIFSFFQENRPSTTDFDNLHSFTAGNENEGEYLETTSPFTSTMLTDKSKNLYLFDNYFLHFYSEKYSTDNMVQLNNPLVYKGYEWPVEIRQETDKCRMFGNHATLYERDDLSRVLVFSVENKGRTGYFEGVDPFYPDDEHEANLNDCQMQCDFVGFHHTSNGSNPSVAHAFAKSHMQTWGGITPYLAEGLYYNGIFGDECGSVTSYAKTFGLDGPDGINFPSSVNLTNPQPVVPVTGISKYMKTNENVIDYSVIPNVTLYFIDRQDSTHVLSTNDLEKVYLNSYARNTGTINTPEFPRALAASFPLMFTHPDYTVCFRYTHNNVVYDKKYEHKYLDCNNYTLVFDIGSIDSDTLEVNSNETDSLTWDLPGVLETYNTIILHENATLNVRGSIHTSKLIMYEGSKLNIMDCALDRVFEVDSLFCYGFESLPSQPTNSDTILIDLVGVSHTGSLKVNQSMNVFYESNWGSDSSVLIKGYGSHHIPNRYSYNIARLNINDNCSVDFNNNTQTRNFGISAKLGSVVNEGILAINDNVICDDYGQLYEPQNGIIGNTFIGNNSNQNISDFAGNFIVNGVSNPVKGIITIGQNNTDYPSTSVLKFQDCGEIEFAGVGQGQISIQNYGKFILAGENSFKLHDNNVFVLNKNSILELNGGDNTSRNGSELVIENSSKLRFNNYNSQTDSIYIIGNKPKSNDYFGDRIRTEPLGYIVSFDSLNWCDQNVLTRLAVSCSNPNARWEGIQINNDYGLPSYEIKNSIIKSIDRVYIQNCTTLKFSNTIFENCKYGIFMGLNDDENQHKNLIITHSVFKKCTNGIYIVDEGHQFYRDPRTIYANITDCDFGERDNPASYNENGISLFRCAIAYIDSCDFYENGYGIFSTSSRIFVGGHYNTEDIQQPEWLFDDPESALGDSCRFYNNKYAGIYVDNSHFNKSLIYHNFFTPTNTTNETGIGVWINKAIVDIMNNKLALLPAHGFLGNTYSRSSGVQYHGFSGNSFINNTGCELIGDATSLTNLAPLETTQIINATNTIRDDLDSSPPNSHVEDPLSDFINWDKYILANLSYADSQAVADIRGNIFYPSLQELGERFYPSREGFIFDEPEGSPLWCMIMDGISLFYSGQFIESKDLFKEITIQHPDSLLTKYAVNFLYLIECCTEQDFQSLREFLDLNISSIDLKPYLEKEAVKTKCYVEEGDYPTAIQRLQLIIDNPSTLVDSVYAMIDQAYCYMRLAMGGTKALPKCAAETPTFDSYISLLHNLGSKVSSLNIIEPNVQVKPMLLPNYPNPFNPETTICLDIPKDGKVILDIYNIKGQKVKCLYQGSLTKGKHRIVWNGKDDNGKPVASGMYISRIECNGKCQARKMMMIK